MLADLRRFYRRCDAIFAPSDSMAQLLREQRMNYDVGIWTRGIDREIFHPGAPRPRLAAQPRHRGRHAGGRLRRPAGDGERASTSSPTRSTGWPGAASATRCWSSARGRRANGSRSACPTRSSPASSAARIWAAPSPRWTCCSIPRSPRRSATSRWRRWPPACPWSRRSRPGSESLVTDGVTGRLIRPGAIEHFCDALAHYCADAEARRAAGEAGFEASQRYGWDAVNHELAEAYMRRHPPAQ